MPTIRWIAIDVGCLECGEHTALIGVFRNRESAAAAVQAAYLKAPAHQPAILEWRGNVRR